MAITIQIRRDTAANWTAVNPILAQGEQAYETDTGNEKIGDGISTWNQLLYKGLFTQDVFYKGFFDTSATLISTYPTGIDGEYAIVGETDTVWVWDIDTSAWVNSGNAQGFLPANSVGLNELKDEVKGLWKITRVDLGTSNVIDWSGTKGTFLRDNLTANASFSFINLPQDDNTKPITLYLNPLTWAIDFPVYCKFMGGEIEPSAENMIMLECINGNLGSESIRYWINPETI